MDVLGAAYYDNDITWWENLDGSGTNWVEHLINGNFEQASSVHAVDIDDDGDVDVLGAANIADDITWWENVNGTGTSWTEHTVDGSFDGAWSVHAADFNGDDNLDVLGAARWAGEITWWDLYCHLPEGLLESSILDTQADPDWDYLEWSSQTPPGTSVAFQIRASDDHSAMGEWSDTLYTEGILEGILDDGDQYVQYRVLLFTTAPDTTPVLLDVMLTWDPMGVEGGEGPVSTAFLQFSPNPAPAPTVRFSLSESSPVELSVFDMSGRMVSQYEENECQSGSHSIILDELTPGVYMCRMTSGDFTAAQRFVVIE
jgi:hypothetical protein